MGDAFSPQQCSIAYLKAQVTHLRQLPPEEQNPRTLSVLNLYEEELKQRDWQVIVGQEGAFSFQKGTNLVFAGRIALLSQ